VSAAAAGTTRRIGRPSHRLVLMLLALSVALNLFFVGGALWVRLHPPALLSFQEQRFHRMASELDLAPQQRTAFNRYVAAMRARTARMHQQLAPLYGAAWEEMAKPQADEAQVMRLFDEASTKRREFQREATNQTLAFLVILSPAQRAEFLAIVQAHWVRWRQNHSAKP
jgi:Spy/CpxP family protein refolding chaperone